jgi:HD-GYP domain-containing protein (c-di-GMP phosphodiesterase class II)
VRQIGASAKQKADVAMPSTSRGGENTRLETRRLREEIKTLRTGVMCALNMLLDLKDLRTGLHATRLAEWAVRVGEHLGVDEIELRDIEAASLLHDIGKIGLPDSILLKPGKLTPEEYAITKKHPEYGWAILRSVPGFERASLLVLHHHERYDGKGYPAGLSGEEIPLGSRIVAIVDSFDAMLSNRAYRGALPVDEAVRRLIADTGTQFDPGISPLFIDLARDHLAELVEGAEDLPVGLAKILP